MRSVDAKLVRPLVGRFTFKKQIFDVFRPTLGQKLLYKVERELFEKELQKYSYEGEKLQKLLEGWYARSVEIFVPECRFPQLEEVYHDYVMSVIFEIEEDHSEEPGVEEKEQPKHRVRQGGIAWRQLIGKICKVFKGESFQSCLNYTEDQLLNMWAETRRQEAIDHLMQMKLSVAVKSKEGYEDMEEALELDAYPFDPESDGDFGREDFEKLRGVLKGIKNAEDLVDEIKE